MAKQKNKRRSGRFLLAMAMLAAIPAWAWWTFSRPGPLTNPAIFLVKKGMNATQVAESLENQGIIRNKAYFRAWARLAKPKILRGEYEFAAKASLADVTKKLTSGEIHITKMVIPPAIHAWSLQQRLEDFIPAEDFWVLWSSPKLKKAAGFPDAPTLEGLIAPATYHLNHAMEPEEILTEMVQAFHRQVLPALQGGVLPPYETLVLASLAEKETRVLSELPRVTSVFFNRLNKPMRLQCDPTSLYARWLMGDLRFTQPLRDDLNRQHPYNTYANMGLPPGPIAIPSIAAIHAAIAPLETDDYYFVATGTGGHYFSKTLEEHNRNVNIYRAELNKKRGSNATNAPAKKAAKKPAAQPKKTTGQRKPAQKKKK
jgi:UPF0755 protein